MERATPPIGSPVYGQDGRVGTVAGVQRRAAGRPEAYLPVRVTHRLGLAHTTRLVPSTWIRAAPSDLTRISLDATRAQVHGCAPLRTDADLQADAGDALASTGGYFQVPTVRATVVGGVVGLTGHFPNQTAWRATLSSVRAIPGVLAVEDRSTEDSALVVAVAQALTQDEDSRAACLRVASRLGEVHLSGELPSVAARDRATAVALAVAGVTRLHNNTTIRTAPAARHAGWWQSGDW